MDGPLEVSSPDGIGARRRQRDGEGLVRGRARYTADLSLPGMAHAAVVRSPHPHARIAAVDGAAARAAPGVLAVLFGADAAAHCGPIPHSLDAAHLGGQHAEIRPLPLDRVRYVGEPVAAIVAKSPAAAARAAALVSISYEPLPAVVEIEDALALGAPLLAEGWDSNVIIAGHVGSEDYSAVAAAAAARLEGEVRAHRGTAAPLETRAWLADFDPLERSLTMFATTQNPHPLRTTLAIALGLEERRIRVLAPRAGGSFGLKMYGNREDFLAAVMAVAVGGPVRWVEERGPSLLPGAHEQIHRYEVAFDADGRVRALRVRTLANHGAPAPGHGWGMAYVGALTVGAGYAIESVGVDYCVVATNKAPWNGTKPFGKDGATLVVEHVMDRVAQATGVDPAEVRRRNLLPPSALPRVTPTGIQLDSGRYELALDRALARLGYDAERERQRAARAAGRAIGVGLAFELTPEGADIPGALVGGFDTSTVRFDPSGCATVLTGVTSPGSASDTGIAQLVAAELGLAVEDVEVVQGDTDRCPYGFGNISSRSLVVGGSAAVLAARDVAARLRTVAARMLETDPAGVILEHATARSGERVVAIAEVAEAVLSLGYVLALDIEPEPRGDA